MLIFSMIALYFLGVTLYGYRISRKEDIEGFMVADRNRMGWVIASSIAIGWLDTGFIVFYLYEFAASGWYTITYLVGSLVSFMIFFVAAKRVVDKANQHHLFTIADYFYDLWSRRSALIIAIINLVLMVMWVIMLFLIGGKIIVATTSLTLIQANMVMLAITLPYLLMGGFRAVLGTDVIQAVLVIVGLGAILSHFMSFEGVVLTAPAEASAYSTEKIIYTLFAMVGWCMVSGDLWVRLYAAKSSCELRKAMVYSPILLAGFAGVLGFIAWNMNVPEGADPLTHLLTLVLTGPLKIIAIGTVFVAILSSLDTCVFGSATAFANDILLKNHLIQSHKLKYVMRFSTLFVMVVGAYTAQFFDSVVDLIYQVLAITIAVGPAIVASLFLAPKYERLIFASLLCGIVGFVYSVFIPVDFTGGSLMPVYCALFPFIFFPILRK